MPKFVAIGYGNEAGYQRTPQDIRDAAQAHDDRLKLGGATIKARYQGRAPKLNEAPARCAPRRLRHHGKRGSDSMVEQRAAAEIAKMIFLPEASPIAGCAGHVEKADFLVISHGPQKPVMAIAKSAGPFASAPAAIASAASELTALQRSASARSTPSISQFASFE